MRPDNVQPVISRDQLKRICEKLLQEAPSILNARDKDDPKMDRKSALLLALYERVRQKLGIKEEVEKFKTDFDTYEFAYLTALYDLLNSHAKQSFQYRQLVEDFLTKALRKR